jgi:hypothetical protein
MATSDRITIVFTTRPMARRDDDVPEVREEWFRRARVRFPLDWDEKMRAEFLRRVRNGNGGD